MLDAIRDAYEQAAHAVECLRDLKRVVDEVYSLNSPDKQPWGDWEHVWLMPPWKPAYQANAHAAAIQALLGAGVAGALLEAQGGPQPRRIGIVAGQSVLDAVAILAALMRSRVQDAIRTREPGDHPSDFEQWAEIVAEADATWGYLNFDPDEVLASLASERAAVEAHITSPHKAPDSIVLRDGWVRGLSVPIELGSRQASVLEALAAAGRPLKGAELVEAAGYGDAVKVITALARKPELRDHIHLPGTRGGGGYSTTIILG